MILALLLLFVLLQREERDVKVTAEEEDLHWTDWGSTTCIKEELGGGGGG